jgi:hypothetical protein
VEDCVTEKDDSKKLNNWHFVALIIVSTFVFTTTISTLIDIFIKMKYSKNKHMFFKVIRCFSMKRNTEKLFDTSLKNEKNLSYNLKFINGFRVISIIWVIIGHTYISGAIFLHKDIPAANFYRELFPFHFEYLFQCCVNFWFAFELEK